MLRFAQAGTCVVALGLVLAAPAGCKKGDEDDKAAATEKASKPTTEEAKGPVTGEALVQEVDRCWGLVEAWDKEALRGCFTDKVEVNYADNVPPERATSVNEAIVQVGVVRNAFPDFKVERSIILVNGSKSADVVRVTGTHRNASLGIPPTGKPISFVQAQVGEHDPQGRTTRTTFYVDQSTVFHQLGVVASATATDAEPSWGEPIRAVAKNDDTERGNLEVVKRSIDALAKADTAGAVAAYADDAVFRYIPEGKPYTGRQEIEQRLGGYSAFDYSITTRDAWAAGDWVVAEITVKGKLKEDFAGTKGTKGKTWELSSLELYRLAGGKVKRHWSFANGLKFAADVGLFDQSMLSASVEEGAAN
jgi:predicted ester cyclase